MFFLFLFSYLCLSYLHDRLFCLPPPPDSFIKFRSLLLRSLCLSVCATSATKSKNNPKKKKTTTERFPPVLPSVNLLGSTGILSTVPPSGWVFILQTPGLSELFTFLGCQGNALRRKMWMHFWPLLNKCLIYCTVLLGRTWVGKWNLC